MRRVTVFNFISLDGCFEGPVKGDISWHMHDEEGRAFSVEKLGLGNMLLFGRRTYDIMSSYWPSEVALRNDPVVAESMNRAEKIVFSKTMDKASWNNTNVMKDDIVGRIREIKRSEGRNMTILGSGSIVTLFAAHGLIDEYQFMVDPIVLGNGTRIFDGIGKQLKLTLTETRVFRNGSVLLCYKPKGEE
jgi:dihydrofolate reductase